MHNLPLLLARCSVYGIRQDFWRQKVYVIYPCLVTSERNTEYSYYEDLLFRAAELLTPFFQHSMTSYFIELLDGSGIARDPELPDDFPTTSNSMPYGEFFKQFISSNIPCLIKGDTIKGWPGKAISTVKINDCHRDTEILYLLYSTPCFVRLQIVGK